MPLESAVIRAGIGSCHPFPHDKTVLDLFLRQVSTRPEQPAVHYRDQTLTYAALDCAANAAAARLCQAGARQGCLIPLLASDGPEFPVGLLGIMKIGAAFVPIDPAWPARRLLSCGRDLDPPVALAVPTACGAVSAMELESRVVYLSGPYVEVDSGSQPSFSRETLPDSSALIYGYYTSGSTGVPKCALNRHRGLVNRLVAMSRQFGDGSTHIVLQNSRATFDSAMWQVLWPLTTGGQLVIPYRDGILDLDQTAHTVKRHAVTTTDFVPSVLAAFVALLEHRRDLCEAVSSLSRILIGGESANPALVGRLQRLLPEAKVTNTYGPTECSIGSVFHEIERGATGKIPLGRPIDNTAAIVLDDDLGPVRRGEIGEICLGGECVGAGYLNDQDRTARAFVPNPFPEVPGERLYRTGDLGYLDHRDLLHFVGRRDDQVKVGGVRVELGDVDAVLASHPLVGNAASVVFGENVDPSLVCCVSSRRSDHPPDEAELRRYAAARLPAEMVPHRVVVVDPLPVNPNGKIDRHALVARLGTALMPAGLDATEVPADATERLVAAAWCDVLDRDTVSVTVPFAEYGGTSLTTMRLSVALGARLGRPVRPRDLVAAATVREQAGRLRGDHPDDAAELAHVIRDAAWRPPSDAAPAVGHRRPGQDRILLTGATGFIGAHLLAELLGKTSTGLVCLVRATDADRAVSRLQATLSRYRLAAAGEALLAGVRSGRVTVESGRLGTELLGLPPDRYDSLRSTVGTVVHAAALVNLLAGYAAHRASNVVGTQELLCLAGSRVRLHALSTLSVFGPAGSAGRKVREQELPTAEDLSRGGYGRSKYVAERLLETGRECGISSVVYRLGEVWPHRRLGVASPDSFAHAVLHACLRTGCVFDTAATTTVTPVDVVARVVIAAATGERPVPDGTLHLLWPMTLWLREAFTFLATRRRLDRVGYAEFSRRVGLLARRRAADPGLVRLHLLLPPPEDGQMAESARFDQLFSSTGDDVEVGRLACEADDAPLGALAGYLRELVATVDCVQ